MGRHLPPPANAVLLREKRLSALSRAPVGLQKEPVGSDPKASLLEAPLKVRSTPKPVDSPKNQPRHVGADFSDCQRALEWIELSAEPREDSPSDPNLQALFEGLQALAREQRDAFLATEPRLPAGASASPRVLGDEKAAQFCVFQVSPAGYPHAQAFDEIALSLHHDEATVRFHQRLVRGDTPQG